MADSSYVAWDGNKYGGEPPEGWYLAADSRWWPQGYAPSPAEVESVKAASGTSETSAEGAATVTDETVSGVVPDVGVSDVSGVVPDVGVSDVSGVVPDVGVSDISGVVPDVGVSDVSGVVPDVGVSDISGVVPDVNVPNINVPRVDDSGPAGIISSLEQTSKPDFGGFGSTGSGFDTPDLPTPDFGVANTPSGQVNLPLSDVNPSAAAAPDAVAGSFDVSEPGGFGTFDSQTFDIAANTVQPAEVPQVGGPVPDHGVAFPDTSSKPAPVSLPASSETSRTGKGGLGSTDSFTAYSKAAEPGKKSRKLLWIGLLALLLLAVLSTVAWFVLGSQSDDTEAATEIDQTSENTGSFNKPQAFNEALNIFYDDDVNSITYRWIVQVVGEATVVAEIDSASGQTLTSATVKVEYREGVDNSTIERLMFSSIGSDLKSTEIDRDCTANLPDGIDFAKSLSPGDTIEGQLCWAISEDLADDQVLAVSSPEAVGAIYFELK